MWVIYWLAFTTYAYSAATLEVWILHNPARYGAFLAISAGLFLTIRFLRNQTFYPGFRFIYEDEPEPAVRTLNLSVPGSW
jgi:hypothetical protein